MRVKKFKLVSVHANWEKCAFTHESVSLFTLRIDTSNYALDAGLLQGEGKDERPIKCASRLVNNAEHYSIERERNEALAVVRAVERFRSYLDGQPIIIRSYHQPLRWLLSSISPIARAVTTVRFAQLFAIYPQSPKQRRRREQYDPEVEVIIKQHKVIDEVATDRVISDNGVQFVSAIMHQCMAVLDMKHNFVLLHHPEANLEERKNRDLKAMLAQLVEEDHTSWAEKLSMTRIT
ncbi:Retrovirus-related Pol polyprotein from transposon 297 [Eumeta japonica]|uniref:Retrovirus-related Pol polyprotein from transposon 297 n=1 Tax=Eumeta variegata TaxID=151549 RepID=A0A4C1Z7C7_EUMVA|nr:Retrovirus-related Pol polyprotein from transposon 297 [Eumeta japonica]